MKDKENLKIGQIISIIEDYEIQTELSDFKILVKKGDEGFVDSKGLLHYLTGAASGKIQIIKGAKPENYALEDITQLIYVRLNNYFNLEEILEDYDISGEDFKSEIEYILGEIL